MAEFGITKKSQLELITAMKQYISIQEQNLLGMSKNLKSIEAMIPMYDRLYQDRDIQKEIQVILNSMVMDIAKPLDIPKELIMRLQRFTDNLKYSLAV